MNTTRSCHSLQLSPYSVSPTQEETQPRRQNRGRMSTVVNVWGSRLQPAQTAQPHWVLQLILKVLCWWFFRQLTAAALTTTQPLSTRPVSAVWPCLQISTLLFLNFTFFTYIFNLKSFIIIIITSRLLFIMGEYPDGWLHCVNKAVTPQKAWDQVKHVLDSLCSLSVIVVVLPWGLFLSGVKTRHLPLAVFDSRTIRFDSIQTAFPARWDPLSLSL